MSIKSDTKIESNTIQLARRTCTPKSAITKVFDEINRIDKLLTHKSSENIINLAIGAPHLAINPVVLEALKQFADTPNVATTFGYSPTRGREDVLNAIVKLYKHYYPKIEFTNYEVMVTNGASQALMNAFSIFIEDGDKVVVFEPYFSTYKNQINLLGGDIALVPTKDDGFRPTSIKLQETLLTHKNVKLLILNYPNNPSGITMSHKELRDMAKILRSFPQLVIIIDDVYRELNFGEHVTLLDVAPDLKARCIVINSGAKGLAGAPDLRIGMVGARKHWIRAMAEQQLNSVAAVSLLTQKALIAAVNAKLNKDSKSEQWLHVSRKVYQDNIKFLRDEFNLLGFTTIAGDGGFFLLVNASKLIGQPIPDNRLERNNDASLLFATDTDITNYLLYTAGVAVVPGSGFGIDETAGYFRVSCAKDKTELEKAMHLIRSAINLILF